MFLEYNNYVTSKAMTLSVLNRFFDKLRMTKSISLRLGVLAGLDIEGFYFLLGGN